MLRQWSVVFALAALCHWLCYRGLLWAADDYVVAAGTERLLAERRDPSQLPPS